MAKPKCKWCKAEVDKATAYVYTGTDNKHYYFCNEQHFNEDCVAKKNAQQEKNEYDEIFDITKEIFGYEFAGYSLLRREITTWERLTTRQKIIAFLKENKDWLSRTMSRNFDNEYGRVRYYSVVVSGKLHDFKPKFVEELKSMEENLVIYDIPAQSLNKRRSLTDLEDDI